MIIEFPALGEIYRPTIYVYTVYHIRVPHTCTVSLHRRAVVFYDSRVRLPRIRRVHVHRVFVTGGAVK